MDDRSLDLPFDPATLQGLSGDLLRSHHRNHHGGAVERLNTVRGPLSGLSLTGLSGFRLNGVTREELGATDSVPLHELYFGGLERWRGEFVAMGKALAGGSGWVFLSFQLDATAVFRFAPANDVREAAERPGAVPSDVPGAEIPHHRESCSFDALQDAVDVHRPALDHPARIGWPSHPQARASTRRLP